MVGRFGGAGITQKLRAGPVLGVAAIAACCLVIASVTTFGHVAMWSIILVGLFNSVMWPNIFALGLAGLGRLTNLGSSLLVTGVLGGAHPSVAGVHGRQYRHPPRILPARPVLRLHRLLRLQRIEGPNHGRQQRDRFVSLKI
ncbi:MAG: hypothetical protein ACYCOX_06865 [Acidobacteriaceae bacterium]